MYLFKRTLRFGRALISSRIKGHPYVVETSYLWHFRAEPLYNALRVLNN